jgi:hypothetical protein
LSANHGFVVVDVMRDIVAAGVAVAIAIVVAVAASIRLLSCSRFVS